MILLQASQEGSGMGALLMFAVTMVFLLSLVLTRKFNLGIYLPGVPVPLRRERKAILKKYFSYYVKLPPEKQKIFEYRVQRFLHQKEFIPRQMKEVREDMKVLIAACAVQLTFGFPNVALSYFTRILVYPNDYYSTISKKYHRGEVNPRLKAIVLSWRHFVDGYLDEKDGRNLGLHEMAHALRIENLIRNNEFGFLDDNIQQQWRIHAGEEIEKIKSGVSTFFRAYAATDFEEFFAVAVENFFERPEAFQQELPQLYTLLALLLHQDPLRP
ncbi:zinc-dependent peptidase [Reichenbachiella ulvae]|uniref:Zinc-dependent peptidase n=1 Tax=Reichenbachiella ulvae TaxID=2980104 RepID=A0ABT3CVV5_9BACT|nr:zinc-dependent peptidase [Reichenbachiella ulvae]MCV9387734.1 zinc-dependent peptidase [Reichenbachiella ulvae]